MGKGNEAVKKYFDRYHLIYQVYVDGDHYPPVDSFDIVVKSSGISFDTPFLKAIEFSKKIVSDLELCQLFNPNQSKITITGTNGKTTTCTLIYELLKSQKKVVLAGNIGIPLFSVLEEEGLMVIEASSFMLHHTETFHPEVAVILNIFPNHLEYHHTFEKYANDKFKLIQNCEENDYLVYNADDEVISKKLEEVNFKGKKLPFSLKMKVAGAYLENNIIWFLDEKILDVCDVRLPGLHNIANILASICVAKIYQITTPNIEKTIKYFKGVPHRLEVLDGKIPIINDSKSTNPLALVSALNCFKGKRIGLIAGGKNKNDDYSALLNHLGDIKIAFLYGENKHILKYVFEQEKVLVKQYNTLDDIFDDLTNYLEAIDVILFSPGSSSLDQYQNFEERGNHFKDLFRKWFISN